MFASQVSKVRLTAKPIHGLMDVRSSRVMYMMKGRLALLTVLLCLFVHGCGGSDGWRTIHPQGVDCTFEMPEPVNNPQRPGYQMYETQLEGGVKIQVAIFPKAFAEPEPGATDADILNKFEKTMLKQVQDNLVASGFDPQMELDGDLAVQDGLGQQVRFIIGQQFVLNLFYITPRGLYYIKVDNGDQNNPTIKRIIESFRP